MGVFTQRDAHEDAAYLTATRDDLVMQMTVPVHERLPAQILSGLEVRRVLDVGCGVGQALLPLAVNQGALGVGLDLSAMACRLGRESFKQYRPRAQTAFLRGQAEALPFATGTFDVVNCTLALPYTRNLPALAEMSRVLRPGGMLILRIHHALFYSSMLWRGVKSADIHPLIHGGRVLLGGAIYHLTGRQCRLKWLRETFQTRWLLRRELKKTGLCLDSELSVSHPLSPYFAIFKTVTGR